VVSDLFPEANGIAIYVTTKTDSRIRVLRIPGSSHMPRPRILGWKQIPMR
jgi:hypothetical protein